ncbi:DM13 domain-containing protein [Actinomadura rudentiformis]|uniref:DM13 domain-containing protein n=1 Tax=Actinomadura rudentiformis TaxID=359158 RepID=A0A6H9YM16_9ACTN|nr:DM13 domain-containing protein [Actinomadura rudentiformis]
MSAAGVLAMGLVAALALAAFQPWKLWVDQTANEAAPPAAAPPVPGAPAAGAAGSGAPAAGAAQGAGQGAAQGAAQGTVARTQEVFSTSSWQSISHGTTTGKVKVYKHADGSYALRLEDLDTSNGPDLKVVLSKGGHETQQNLSPDYRNLGTLKGNKGSSNYSIAAGVDLSQYKSVVIWCKRFDSVFAAAPIRT